MKAVFIEQFGGPEVLKYGDFPDPVAEPGEVIIDGVAASVNAADWKFRAGEYTRHAVWSKNRNRRKDGELSSAGVASWGGAGYDFLGESIANRGGRMDWARILAFVTGMVDQELLARNEYLAAAAESAALAALGALTAAADTRRKGHRS